jgi:SNF2 family DNA or RNA helicase
MNVELMQHQKDAVNFAVNNKGISAFFHEIGCGKTLSALATFTELRKTNPSLKLLVICPLSLIYGAWVREIEKFTNFNWYDFHADKSSGKNEDITIVNFESLISERKFHGLKDMMINISICHNNSPWMCVIDESSKMKNNKAKTVERILSLKKHFKHRIVMSGTPAPNVEWEYWPQMYFLNEDILGSNFYKFKNTHFALTRGNQMMPGQFMNAHTLRKMHEQGFKYQITPAKRKEMFGRMKPWCHYVKAVDCIDLPEEIDEFRSIELTPPQRKVYKQMEKSYIAELTDPDTFIVANIALTKLMKLRQITSGFAINDQNEEVCVTEKNPKMDALAELIEECQGKQMIIWCQFHWEIDQIKNMLLEYNAGISELHGRISYNSRDEHFSKFINGENRFLIAHPDSAGHGLTMTNCHISVFFSMDYSMEGYSQARGRTYRKGQKNNCLYFHLIAKDSIDEDVLAIVQRKETAQGVAERYLKHART